MLLTLNHQKLFFDLFMFRTPITLKYILSNASFAFALLEGCLKNLSGE
jgi:hypothetical protein